MTLLAVRESGPLASRQVETFLLAQGAAFDLSGDIALNTAHRQGDGSDHADVALNNAHRAIVAGNPHGTSAADVGLSNVTNDAQLKRSAADFNSFGTAALALTDIILLESSGGAFAKIKATLQALKDLIGGGGGGGGSWTNVSSYTVTGAETDIDFTDLTDGPYMFVFESLSMSGQLHLLHSVDNGVLFSGTAAEYHYHQNRTAVTSGNYSGQGNNGANAYYLLCHLTTGLSDRSIEGEIFVATKRLTKTLLIRSDLVVHSNSDTNQKLMARGPQNVDALRFHTTSGTFLTGKIHLLKFDGRA